MRAAANHIAILCSRLDLAGGIERAVVNTANLFARNGQTVSIVILDETDKSFYPIDSGVKVIQQPLSFGISREGNPVSRKIRLLSDVLKLRKLLKHINPTHVVGSEYPFTCAAILSGQRKRSKVFAWEHHHYYELKRSSFWERVFKNAYPKLDGIICLNDDEKKIYSSLNRSVSTIPNFVQGQSPSSLQSKRILTVGRLTPVKGIDLLLEVAAIVLHRFPDWEWKLIGEGEMKDDVVKIIQKEKLVGRLQLQAPVSDNLDEEYRSASLYAMTSRNECFPMTLLEAQSFGLPCVAFDCDSGPRHIIINNQNGLLTGTENTAELADAISSLIRDDQKRKTFGANAYEDVKKFSPENVYALWEQLMASR